MDLESSLDRMCMGVEELNFRMARIEIAIRRQNLRVRLSESVLVIKDISVLSAVDIPEGQGRIDP
jgi:hypothetical protein